MHKFKTLLLLAILATIFSCQSKKKGDRLINTGLNDIHLPSQEAENDFNKGLFYVRQENYSAAKDFFLMADKESPNTPVILNAIGNCMDRTGEAMQGFTYFIKAMQIDSNFIRTYANYGCSLNNNQSFDEAEKIFRLGLSRQRIRPFDKSALYLNLADTYYHRNQNVKALSLLDSAKLGLTNRGLYDQIVQFQNKIKQDSYP